MTEHRDWPTEDLPHPRPWRTDGRGHGRTIVDANGDRVGWMQPATLATATVEAVNEYGTRAIGVRIGQPRETGNQPPDPQVVNAVDWAITDLTGQPQLGSAYAKAFVKRLAEFGVTVSVSKPAQGTNGDRA